MKTVWNAIQTVITVIGGGLGWFLGGLDGFLYALIAFIIIDYLTGVLCAVVNKKLSSEIGAKGIIKKVLIFVLVGMAHILDTYVVKDVGAIRTAVIFFYLSNEGISLLENASRLGLPIPQKIKDVLAQLHNKSGEDDNKNK